MESVVLALVLIVWIYIGYWFFSSNVYESFMPSNTEDTLGKVAVQGKGPNSLLSSSNNPTGLMATYSNPIVQSTAEATQHRYETALGIGKENAGPRIDDTTSFLYMVDFCYTKGQQGNPFSDPTFAANCGMCMTMGTTITGQGPGSNFGLVVYPEDKAYSLNQGTDAIPSAHSATCAPLVKALGTGANVRSIAINSAQYEETLAYKQSNSYTVTKGTGNGTKSLVCSGKEGEIDYVIKQGFSRVGAWDKKIATANGDSIDYSRTNNLDTTPFAASCTETTSCTSTGNGMQWDMSARCGYPKPKEFTNLTRSERTATSLTFSWQGGLYGEPEGTLFKNGQSVDAAVTSGIRTVTFSNLTPDTKYTLKFRLQNKAGTWPHDESFTDIDGITEMDVKRPENLQVSGSGVIRTVTWGETNATSLVLNIAGMIGAGIPVTSSPYQLDTELQALKRNTQYTLTLAATYAGTYNNNQFSSISTTFTA